MTSTQCERIHRLKSRPVRPIKSLTLEVPEAVAVERGRVKWGYPSPLEPHHGRKTGHIGGRGLGLRLVSGHHGRRAGPGSLWLASDQA